MFMPSVLDIPAFCISTTPSFDFQSSHDLAILTVLYFSFEMFMPSVLAILAVEYLQQYI